MAELPEVLAAVHTDNKADLGLTSAGVIVTDTQHRLIEDAVSSITAAEAGHITITGVSEEDGGVIMTVGGNHADQVSVDSEHQVASLDPVILTAQPQDIISSNGQSAIQTDNTTLQSLLAAPSGTTSLTTSTGETIQIITLANMPGDLATLAQGGDGKVWQLLPSASNPDVATIIAVNPTEQEAADAVEHIDQVDASGHPSVQISEGTVTLTEPNPALLMPPPQNLPPGCPTWAARLRDCETIGDSYRGWVESEVELDLLLTYHKQQTQSFWGTRQSPSPAKQSTRLMWKSQYVPFDGIPFVNAGSRAIVMECQYGPRRKGSQKKQEVIIKPTDYKQTCPARIYIKKVRKFPDYTVDPTLDKKNLKLAMDKSFNELKMRGIEGWGQERYYVQLPTEKAHEFHSDEQFVEIIPKPARLHPRVATKVRELVSGGETRLYAIRKALRKFVERELFENCDLVPERHNLTYFPTVNDLQNHIHQAVQDIETGLLPVTASLVNVEVITTNENSTVDGGSAGESELWQTSTADSPHAETVTVTLTQNPGEDGHHVISRVETHLSDGSTRISQSLSPETAQLLAKLHPNMFPPGNVAQTGMESEVGNPIEGDTSTQTQSLTVVNPVDATTNHVLTSAPMQTTDMSLLTSTDHDHSQTFQLQIVQSDEAMDTNHVDGDMLSVAMAPAEYDSAGSVHLIEEKPKMETDS